MSLPHNLDKLFPDGFWICVDTVHPPVGIAKGQRCSICAHEESVIPSFEKFRDYPISMRVWDTKLKSFCPWNALMSFNDPSLIILRGSAVYDENLVEIFEGDRVIFRDESPDRAREVYYAEGSFQITDLGPMSDFMFTIQDKKPILRDFRIKGNIFE